MHTTDTLSPASTAALIGSPGELPHALLTCPATRQAARDITDRLLSGLPEDMPLYALLTALGSTFVALCDDHDIDPEPAFAQVMGTTFRDPGTLGERTSVSAEMAHVYQQQCAR